MLWILRICLIVLLCRLVHSIILLFIDVTMVQWQLLGFMLGACVSVMCTA